MSTDIKHETQEVETTETTDVVETISATEDDKTTTETQPAHGDKTEAVDVVEKEVVSNDATAGIYNFSKGNVFVDAADSMIAKNLRVNGEFYVAPVYKQMIEKGMKIKTYDISGKMYGLGTPDDLTEFENKQSFDYLPTISN